MAQAPDAAFAALLPRLPDIVAAPHADSSFEELFAYYQFMPLNVDSLKKLEKEHSVTSFLEIQFD